MQKTNNIIIKAALAVFSAFLATSCFLEKMAMPEDLQSVLIQVNVSSDEMLTKADTETPTTAESAINTVRIYAFRDGKLSGHYYSGSVDSDPIVMDLRLPETGTCDLDFYVIANETSMTRTSGTEALSESTTETALAGFAFSAFGAVDGSLPMYGTAEVTIDVDNVSSQKNTTEGHTDHKYITDGPGSENVFTVNLKLERPVAKVSFYVETPNGSADQVYLSDLTMPSKGTRQYGYLLPQAPETLQTIPATAAGIDFLSSSILVKGTASDPMPVFENVYFFEVPYGSSSWYTPNSDNSVVFDVSFTGGNGSVYMPPIERNTHYKVYCTFPPGEGSIEVSYVVADWAGDHEWILDFAHPTYQNPVLKTGDHASEGGKATMYYTGTEEGAFSVDFKMTAPTGQTWNPTFFGNTSDYAIKVYDKNGSPVQTPVTASDDFYTIKIIPLKPENIGSTVQFGIAYTPSWTADPEFLLINGSSDNMKWITEGSTEDLIVVEQIENN